MSRTTKLGGVAALGTIAAIVLLTGVPAAADPASPAPGTSPSRTTTVTTAGTSFLTAVTVPTGRHAKVQGSTGDYLYWSFATKAGDTASATARITLPQQGSRHAAETWSIEVFDGLRRRQACTDGKQAPVASAADAAVSLSCTLREVRSWAEPWSGDPLPGTYYVRIFATDLPEQDLGLPVDIDLVIGTDGSDDPAPEGGDLAAPLVPAARPGSAAPSAAPSQSATATANGSSDDWLPDLPDASSRWAWTAAGGILAAIAAVAGFALTRRPLRRRLG
jgi:hypothetical protein